MELVVDKENNGIDFDHNGNPVICANEPMDLTAYRSEYSLEAICQKNSNNRISMNLKPLESRQRGFRKQSIEFLNKLNLLLEQELKNNDAAPPSTSTSTTTAPNLSWCDKGMLPFEEYDELCSRMSIQDSDIDLADYHKQARMRLERHQHIFISHTHNTSTVSEYAVDLALQHHTRIIYISPYKSSCYQHYRHFTDKFGNDNIGMITDDMNINSQQSICLIITPEIFLQLLYVDTNSVMENVEYVVFDEMQCLLTDNERGVIWEEILILLPTTNITLLLQTSSRIPATNISQLCEWIGHIKQQTIYLISSSSQQESSLRHFLYHDGEMYNVMDDQTYKYQKVLIQIKHHQQEKEKLKQQALEEKAQRCGEKAAKAAQLAGKRLKEQKHLAREATERELRRLTSNKGKVSPTKPAVVGGSKADWLKLIKVITSGGLSITATSTTNASTDSPGPSESIITSTSIIIINFSKKKCDEISHYMKDLTLLTINEQNKVRESFDSLISRVNPIDMDLSQIHSTKDLLLRGIGVYHSGILPILKEIVEILYSQCLIKVLITTDSFTNTTNMYRCNNDSNNTSIVFNGYHKYDNNTAKLRLLSYHEYLNIVRYFNSNNVIITSWNESPPNDNDIKLLLVRSKSMILRLKYRLRCNMMLNVSRKSLSILNMMRLSLIEYDYQMILLRNDYRSKLLYCHEYIVHVHDKIQQVLSNSIVNIEERNECHDIIMKYYELIHNCQTLLYKHYELLYDNMTKLSYSMHAFLTSKLFTSHNQWVIRLFPIGRVVHAYIPILGYPALGVIVVDPIQTIGDDKTLVHPIEENDLWMMIPINCNELTEKFKASHGNISPIESLDTSDGITIMNELHGITSHGNHFIITKLSIKYISFISNNELTLRVANATTTATTISDSDVMNIIDFNHVINELTTLKLTVIEPFDIARAFFGGSTCLYEYQDRLWKEVVTTNHVEGKSHFTENKLINYLLTMSSSAITSSSVKTTLYQHYYHYSMINKYIKDFEYVLSDNRMYFYSDYEYKLKLLIQLGYIVEEGESKCSHVITKKGQIACELLSCDEIFGTEILCNSILLETLSTEELIAMLSVLVAPKQTDASDNIDTVNWTENMIKMKDEIEHIHNNLKELREFEVAVGDPDVQETAVNFDLCYVIFQWVKGLSFKDIVKLTTHYDEGKIVNLLTRLYRLCCNIMNVAKIMGNHDLYFKMKDVEKIIKRDIIFVPSLYYE